MLILISLIYVAITVLTLLPFTYLVGAYERRINVEELMKELVTLEKRISSISPEKEKKLRTLKSRYSKVRKRVMFFMMLGLFSLWIAILVAIILARLCIYALFKYLGVPPFIHSPISIPFISFDHNLNDAILIMAIIIAYYPFHIKYSGLYKLRR